jgi:hypothetical protein
MNDVSLSHFIVRESIANVGKTPVNASEPHASTHAGMQSTEAEWVMDFMKAANG